MRHDRQHFLARLHGLLRLAIQPRVVDRQRAVARQLADQRRILLREERPLRCRREDHAQRLAAADQRHGQQRALLFRRYSRVMQQRGRVADDVRLALLDDQRQRLRDVAQEFAHAFFQLVLAHDVAMRDRRTPQRAVRFREIDDADVGDVRHDQPRQRGDGVLIIERRRQFLSCGRQERGAALLAFGRGAGALRFRRLALRLLTPPHRLACQKAHLPSEAGHEQR